VVIFKIVFIKELDLVVKIKESILDLIQKLFIEPDIIQFDITIIEYQFLFMLIENVDKTPF